MTDTPSDLEQRVAALEARWAELADRVTMEAGLRAAGDRDLATIGQTVNSMQRLVQALAITQSKHTATLAEHTARLDHLTVTVDGIKRDHGAALERIVSMLDELIRRESGGAGQPDLT